MKSCIYCGNNPVNHPTHKFYQSFDILVSPLRRTIFQTWFGKFTDQLTTYMGLAVFHMLKPLRLIKINRDINKIQYPRARVLWEEAFARNIEIEEIKPFGQPIDLYRAKIEDKYHYFVNLPRKESEGLSNLSWVDDKFLLKKKLLEHNLPVAVGGSFRTLSKALKTFNALEKPVIVKPRAGSRGRHTTTFVYTKEQLTEAFKIAKQLCSWVIVEEHLFGDVQRGTVIGGKLIGVLGGSPPRVTGDGTRTIAELTKIKDSQRPEKVKPIQINLSFLQRQNLTLMTILPIDKTVMLSEKIGVNYGGTSYNCTPQTHPDTIKMFEEAGKILDISIVGFDFIIPDISKSYKEQKSGIIEANGAPFINLHHDPLYGESINAAKYVWDMVLASPPKS